MTTQQLGRRVGVGQSSISEAETAEVEGRITLGTLRKIAEGLNCDVAYALLPRARLDDMVHDQATRLATKMVAEVATAMDLEAQSTDSTAHETEVAALRERLIAEGSSRIWD